ncbi:MAG TPA: hypothetical protein VKU00_25960 [Chthonomonadaceae bacterium]|nr:hypothetical protein [Chthonomonadaceae bacterium]
MSFLANAKIKIGVDLEQGGTITYLSPSGSDRNIINAHDRGRQIQLSFYSGPQPYGQAHPAWKNWPWNPIGTGDVYGHASQVLTCTNDGKTLYVKSIPLQWALDNVPGECTFETWITLSANTAHVRNRLVNHRSDRTPYAAFDQELPAVYTVGKLYRLFTYDGSKPFTGQPARRIENNGPPWAGWSATEHWAALLDDSNWGLGIVHPGVFTFIGGFHGPPNVGGPKEDSTGYIAPVRKEILDHNIDYEYHYDLVLGTLDQIREYANASQPKDQRPDYVFSKDRQHWIYVNAQDTGWPIEGHLRVKLEQDDPQMIGPEQWWSAETTPDLFIRAAFQTKLTRAEIFWKVLGQTGFAGEQRVSFEIKPDGQFHTYRVHLAGAPGYTGTITGLRFDPIPSGGPGEYADIAWISWRQHEQNH